jgi:predicted ArsR family transcriptional regulator
VIIWGAVKEDRWSAAAALVDSSRRALYDHVRQQDHPVSREEAAAALQISRNLAAFHLDKLVEAGLLRARYQPPPDRPRGRGRAPKVYEPAGDGLAITIPERRYRLLAEILADAIAAGAGDAAGAARHHAREQGQALGARLRDATPPGSLAGALAQLGFEPAAEADGTLLLHNCPFHALAARQTELVCGLNHEFLTGLVRGLAVPDVRADLAPRPGACCVQLAPEPGAVARRGRDAAPDPRRI